VLPAESLPTQFSQWGIQRLVAMHYDRVKGKRKQSYIRYFISSRVMEAGDVGIIAGQDRALPLRIWQPPDRLP